MTARWTPLGLVGPKPAASETGPRVRGANANAVVVVAGGDETASRAGEEPARVA